jgi:hypothetical protein
MDKEEKEEDKKIESTKKESQDPDESKTPSKEKPDSEEKQETKDESKEKKETPISTKQNKQLIVAISLMILIFLILLIVPFIKNNYVDEFEYYNLEFKKIKTPNTLTYDVLIPIIDKQGKVLAYPWNFRNDPRDLENINIDIENNSIIFQKDKTTYLSVEKESPQCEDNIVSVITLLNFLDDFGNLQMEGAVSDKEHANKTEREHITCENTPRNTVIMLKSGDENLISNPKQNCYEIKYKGCDINQVSEKFLYVIIENYMETFEKDFRPNINWAETEKETNNQL